MNIEAFDKFKKEVQQCFAKGMEPYKNDANKIQDKANLVRQSMENPENGNKDKFVGEEEKGIDL
jgi:hypothetical protein